MPKKTPLDIFVLAVLSDGPLHGYDIIARMHREHFERWIEVGDSSIYQSLSRLEKKGYVKTSEIRIGKNPPRTVYEINKEGERYLEDGLLELLKTPPLFPDGLNIPLFASKNLNKADLIAALEEQKRIALSRQKEIEEEQEKTKDQNSDIGMQLIYQRLLALHKAHVRWLTDAIFLIKRRR